LKPGAHSVVAEKAHDLMQVLSCRVPQTYIGFGVVIVKLLEMYEGLVAESFESLRFADVVSEKRGRSRY
jgi:hypothetical protein